MRRFDVFRFVVLRAPLAALGVSLLCSCASVQVHDEARAKLAASGKKDYGDAKVTEVIEASRKNAAFLLAAEVDAVRENYAVQVDIATLEIANNSTPMSDTHREATQRYQELGFKDVAQLRQAFHAEGAMRNAKARLAEFEKVFSAMGVSPNCNPVLAKVAMPAGLTDTQRNRLEKIYPDYLERCSKLKPQDIPAEGLIGRARADWRAAQATRDEARQRQRDAEKKVAEVKAPYDERVRRIEEAKKRGKAIADDLTGAAQGLADVLAQVKSIDASVVDKEQIDALVELLTAVAGGEVDPKDPRVARAAAVAKQIPPLVADIENLEATRTAPPVSGLLLALRHKTLLADAAKKRAQLEDERVDILKAKYDAYYAEADRLLRFLDAACSYSALSANQAWPGTACDGFSAPNDAGECVIVGRPRIAKCALGRPWKEALRSTAASDTRREVYKAATNYLQAVSLQAVPMELTFREIDVRQREVLLAKGNAMETWDNLVSVPLDQLDGYYQGGIKPAEIADLILRALTFTAIAIGVSK